MTTKTEHIFLQDKILIDKNNCQPILARSVIMLTNFTDENVFTTLHKKVLKTLNLKELHFKQFILNHVGLNSAEIETSIAFKPFSELSITGLEIPEWDTLYGEHLVELVDLPHHNKQQAALRICGISNQ